jgi:hypothetical protein
VLVRESFAACVSSWQPPGQPQLASPYHIWLRLDGASLPSPLFLAAVYLPPFRSKYGCKSPAELGDYFTLLGDEVTAALATPGGAGVMLAGDFNAHTGNASGSADHSAVLRAALADDSGELLLYSATAFEPPPRASSCNAAVCEQGRGLLHLCETAGVFIANGRLQGDQQGSPTFHTGSVIDYFLLSPSLLSQAEALRVLPQVPEYQQHSPLELRLAPVAAAPAGSAARPADPESEGFGPAPTFAAPLRLTPDGLSSFADQLAAPTTAAALQQLADTASSDPLQAATQLHSLLYETAAAIFPTSGGTRPRAASTTTQLRRRHQPWFDAECAATQQRLRLQMQASVASGQPSHLARAAIRACSNRYAQLRQRKATLWRQQKGTALLQLQRHNPRVFYKRWKRQNPDSPINAATWLRHFVHLQLKRVFKPTSNAPTNTPSPPAPVAAAGQDTTPSPLTLCWTATSLWTT